MDTVRDIIKQRDGVDDAAVDLLFEEFQDSLDHAGIRPGYDDVQDALQQVFGLEPDYMLDDEVVGALARVGK